MPELRDLSLKPDKEATLKDSSPQSGSEAQNAELLALRNEIKALQEKNALLQAHIDNTDDIVLVVSSEGKIIDISANWSKYLDYDPDYLTDLPHYGELIHPEDRERTFGLFSETLAEGKAQRNMEYRILARDGSTKWFYSNTSPLFDESGKIYAVIALARDITEQKLTLQALEESKRQMKEAQIIGKIGDWEWRSGEDFVRWSDEMYRIFNVEPGTLITRQKADEIFPETERERVLGLTQRAIDTGESQSVESQIVRDNGEIGYIFGKGKAIKDEQGRLLRIVGFYQDITDRKLYEEELKKSEARYRLLIETMQEGVVIVDNDDVIQYINKSCCDLFGYTAEFLTGKIGYKYIILEEDQHLIIDKNLHRQNGHSDVYEVRGKTTDGQIIWLKISGTPLHDENGVVFGSMGIMTDITEQKKAEQERFRLLNLLNTSLNEIYMFDAVDFKFFYANQGAIKNTGYSKEELQKLHIFSIVRDYNPETLRTKLQPLLTGSRDTLVFETIHTRKDGSSYPVEVHIQLYKQDEGELFLSVVNNITERRSLQEQLLASQKMDAIGRLAGGIAHDFNNLLTVILGYGEELQSNLAIDDPSREEVAEILKAGQRAAELTRQLLAFSRKQVIQPKIMDLNHLLANLDGILRRLLGDQISLETKLQSDLWQIKADPGQLEQLIVNLAVNSRDAMPQGGSLKIKTKNIQVSADSPLGTFAALPGDYVLISVSDTGKGMDKETKSRIFEPFFSTKEANKGLGLGLSTVYGIVKQAGGFIAVDSEPDNGACFRIYLPATQEKPVSRMSASLGNELMGNGEKIMIVEDEESLLQLFDKLITNLGYRVSVCANGLEALKLIESGYRPDVMITDVIMPALNGKELVDRILELMPEQKIIYMSGFTDDVLANHGVFAQDIPFIQKPFTARGIAIKIKQLLGK